MVSHRVRSSAPVRLIALDLDGTLVGDDLVIRPRVRQAIAAARQRGVLVAIVTGRMFAAARPFAQLLELDTPVVCYQGAAIFDPHNGKTLACTPVPQDVTRDVLAWADARGVHAQCYADDVLYVASVNRYSRRYTDIARVAPRVVPSLQTRFADAPTTKIVLVADPDDASRYLDELRPQLGDRAYLTRSHVDFVEILDPRVNKGLGLRWLAERFGIPLDATLAVGDAWNDVPMFQAAGTAIAMGSAPPEVQAEATAVVADTAHEGVAEALERHVFG